MAVNQVDVVFIGGGAISTMLSSRIPNHISLKVYSIREIKSKSDNEEIFSVLKSAHMVVYLAYHHRNLFVNLNTLNKVLGQLSAYNWKGMFVYFNTQSALDTSCYKSSRPIPRLFQYDLYSVTKRLQSRMLRSCDSSMLISELYLPVVIGKGSKAETWYRFIACHRDIFLPNYGENKILLLDLSSFILWFWGCSAKFLLSRDRSLMARRLFVYNKVMSASELINKLREKDGLGHVNISNYSPSYWFSNKLIGNLIWSIKQSPLGLLVYLLTGSFRDTTASIATSHGSTQPSQSFIDQVFVPNSPECALFAKEVVLNKINFNILDIHEST